MFFLCVIEAQKVLVANGLKNEEVDDFKEVSDIVAQSFGFYSGKLETSK